MLNEWSSMTVFLVHKVMWNLLAQIHTYTGCWMKIVLLFEVTLLVHMVPAATHANGDLCFVTQFQAVGVNECLIKQNNGHLVHWPRQCPWTVYIVKVKIRTQSETPSKYCDSAETYICRLANVNCCWRMKIITFSCRIWRSSACNITCSFCLNINLCSFSKWQYPSYSLLMWTQ